MNKPAMLPAITSGLVAHAPSAFVQSPVSTKVANSRAAILPTRPAQQAATPEYVYPYFFETGYYTSSAEYE